MGDAASAAATAVGLHAVVEGVGAVIKDLQGDAAEVAELPSSIRLSFNANGEFVLARAACVRTPALQAEWVAADESSEAGDRGSSDEPLGLGRTPGARTSSWASDEHQGPFRIPPGGGVLSARSAAF